MIARLTPTATRGSAPNHTADDSGTCGVFLGRLRTLQQEITADIEELEGMLK